MAEMLVKVSRGCDALERGGEFAALVSQLQDVQAVYGGEYLEVTYVGNRGLVRRTPQLEAELARLKIPISN